MIISVTCGIIPPPSPPPLLVAWAASASVLGAHGAREATYAHTYVHSATSRTMPVRPSMAPFAFDPQGQSHQFLAGLNAERTRPLKLYPRTAKLEDARRQRGCDAALSPPAKVGGLALSVVRARRGRRACVRVLWTSSSSSSSS